MTTDCVTGAAVLADREVWRPDLASQSPGTSTTVEARRIRSEIRFARGTITVEATQLEPRWLYPVMRMLREISELQDGWDSYSAKPIRIEAAAAALRIASEILANETTPPVVVPIPDGGLQLEWHSRQSDLEIVVGPEGAASAFYRNTATADTHEFDKALEHLPALRAWAALV